MIDKEGTCIAVSIYHLDNEVYSKMTEKDVIYILDPFLKIIDLSSFENPRVRLSWVGSKNPLVLIHFVQPHVESKLLLLTSGRAASISHERHGHGRLLCPRATDAR